MPVSTSVDLRHLMPSIEDQSVRDTCIAFAFTADHEVERKLAVQLSEEHLYWQAKQMDMRQGIKEPGLTFDSALKVLINTGQVADEFWAYAPNSTPLSPPAGVLSAGHYSISEFRPVPTEITAIQDFLEQGTCVVSGIRVYPNFMRAGTTVVQTVPAGSPGGENHAIVIVGYNGLSNDPDGYFIVRNSWGSAWGDNGYGFVSYDYMREHLLQAYWIRVKELA